VSSSLSRLACLIAIWKREILNMGHAPVLAVVLGAGDREGP